MQTIKVIDSATLRVVREYPAENYPEVFDDGIHFKIYNNGDFSRAYPHSIYHYEITEKENES